MQHPLAGPGVERRAAGELADGTLPFSTRAQEIARRITIYEAGTDYVLHAKTGWGDHAAQNHADPDKADRTVAARRITRLRAA